MCRTLFSGGRAFPEAGPHSRAESEPVLRVFSGYPGNGRVVAEKERYLSPETVCRVRREQASGIRINRDGTIRSPENGFHRLSVPERECRACTVIRFQPSVRFWYVCPDGTGHGFFHRQLHVCTAAIFCITKKRPDDDAGCLSRYPAGPVPARGTRGRHAVPPGRVNTSFRRTMLLSAWFMSASGFGFFIVRQGGRLAGSSPPPEMACFFIGLCKCPLWKPFFVSCTELPGEIPDEYRTGMNGSGLRSHNAGFPVCLIYGIKTGSRARCTMMEQARYSGGRLPLPVL